MMSSGRSRLLFSSVRDSRSIIDARSCNCLKGGGRLSPSSRQAIFSLASSSHLPGVGSAPIGAPRQISPSSLYPQRAFSPSSVSYDPSDLSPSSRPSHAVAAVQAVPSRDQQQFTAESESARWATAYLYEAFPSLPGEFPSEVAKRIMTHMSYRPGAQTYGHNARLSFLGRRVLKAYLLMYIQSSVPEEVMLGPGAGRTSAALGAPKDASGLDGFADFDEFIENALDTRTLGERVASAWRLENGVRWTSAIPPTSQFSSTLVERSYQKGKAKVMGTTVEAVVGGIFHQFGGVAAYSFFHTRVLPHLNLPTSLRSSLANVPFQKDSAAESTAGEHVLLVEDYSMASPKRRAVA